MEVEVDLLWTSHDSLCPMTTLMHIIIYFFILIIIILCLQCDLVFDHFLAKLHNIQQSSCKLLSFMSFHCVELLAIRTVLNIVCNTDPPSISWRQAVVSMGKSSSRV